MTRMKYLVAAATLNLFWRVARGQRKKYLIIRQMKFTRLHNKSCRTVTGDEAITQLEALDNRYPFGPYSQQVQLDLIYAYYKTPICR